MAGSPNPIIMPGSMKNSIIHNQKILANLEKQRTRIGLKPLPGVVNDARGTFVKLNSVVPQITKDHF